MREQPSETGKAGNQREGKCIEILYAISPQILCQILANDLHIKKSSTNHLAIGWKANNGFGQFHDAEQRIEVQGLARKNARRGYALRIQKSEKHFSLDSIELICLYKSLYFARTVVSIHLNWQGKPRNNTKRPNIKRKKDNGNRDIDDLENDIIRQDLQ